MTWLLYKTVKWHLRKLRLHLWSFVVSMVFQFHGGNLFSASFGQFMCMSILACLDHGCFKNLGAVVATERRRLFGCVQSGTLAMYFCGKMWLLHATGRVLLVYWFSVHSVIVNFPSFWWSVFSTVGCESRESNEYKPFVKSVFRNGGICHSEPLFPIIPGAQIIACKIIAPC